MSKLLTVVACVVFVLAQSIVTTHAQTTARRLGFGEALSIALVKSPLVLASADRLELATIQERVSRAQFDLKFTPSLATGTDPFGGAQRTLGLAATRRLTTGAQVAVAASSVRYSGDAAQWNDGVVTASVTQPLLGGLGAAATADLDEARRAGTTAVRAHVEARQQLVLSVAAAYFAVARSTRLATAATLALGRAERLKVASEARAKVGLATQLDVLRADLLVSQAQATLATQQESAETMLDQLKRLLGASLSAGIDIGDEAELDKLLARVDPARLPVDSANSGGSPTSSRLESLVQLAMHHRIELTEARDKVEDAKRHARVARSNLLPRIDLTASYTKHGFGQARSAPFNDLFGGWRVGLTTSYPLDRAAQMGSYDTTSVAIQSAQRAMEQTVEDVSAEVRRAHRSWVRSGEVAVIQQKAIDLAEKQLRLAQLRYERGLAGNFDVVDAEANVYQAQSSLIDVQIERVLAALSLRRAVGLLQPEELAR